MTAGSPAVVVHYVFPVTIDIRCRHCMESGQRRVPPRNMLAVLLKEGVVYYSTDSFERQPLLADLPWSLCMTVRSRHWTGMHCQYNYWGQLGLTLTHQMPWMPPHHCASHQDPSGGIISSSPSFETSPTQYKPDHWVAQWSMLFEPSSFHAQSL